MKDTLKIAAGVRQESARISDRSSVCTLLRVSPKDLFMIRGLSRSNTRHYLLALLNSDLRSRQAEKPAAALRTQARL